jgi:predicted outer membrane repeat protein
MHLKLLRAAAAVALIGGTATLGLGTQAAMAQTTRNVLCSTNGTDGLVYWMTGANYTSGDTLSLAPHCTYWVSAALPSVMKTLIIDGNGDSIVATASGFSIFVVGCAEGDLTLNNLTVKNGGGSGVDGGAVDVSTTGATLNVNSSTFSDNSADHEDGPGGGYGGAIANEGTVNVYGSTFTGNSANWGGAVYSENGVSSAILDDDTFTGNNANEGGAIYNDDNNMQIGEDSFRDNSATGEGGDGGAIYNEYTLEVDVAVSAGDTLFEMNSASDEGGAIYNDDETVNLDHSVVELNRAWEGGGGIYNDEGTVVLTSDTIQLNTPNNCDPVMTIDGCTG